MLGEFFEGVRNVSVEVSERPFDSGAPPVPNLTLAIARRHEKYEVRRFSADHQSCVWLSEAGQIQEVRGLSEIVFDVRVPVHGGRPEQDHRATFEFRYHPRATRTELRLPFVGQTHILFIAGPSAERSLAHTRIDGAHSSGYWPRAVSPEPLTRKPLQAGQEIDAWCTKCRLDLGHRVVAMVQGIPKRVICMTCGSEHNYRAPKSAPAARAAGKTRERSPAAKSGASATKSGASKSRVSAHAEWENAVRSGRPFRRYLASEEYAAGDLIQHKKFGDGLVRDTSGHDKIIVAFSDGDRTLIHRLPA